MKTHPFYNTIFARLALCGWLLTVSSLCAGTFNVRDYGAVADDKTDNTPAFSACLKALVEAGGGTMMIPDGVYRGRIGRRLSVTSTISATLAPAISTTGSSRGASARSKLSSKTVANQSGPAGSVSPRSKSSRSRHPISSVPPDMHMWSKTKPDEYYISRNPHLYSRRLVSFHFLPCSCLHLAHHPDGEWFVRFLAKSCLMMAHRKHHPTNHTTL